MDIRCCWRRNSVYLCVILLHAIVFVSLTTALLIRFHVFEKRLLLDSPSDQRVISNSQWSVFCENHKISTHIKQDDGLSNTNPNFELFALPGAPKTLNITSKSVRARLVGLEGLEVSGYKTYPFYWQTGTTAKVSLCADAGGTGDEFDRLRQPNTLSFFITKGGSTQRLLNELEKGIIPKKCDFCEQSGTILLNSCNRSDISFEALSEDEFTLTLYNPADGSPAPFRAEFQLNLTHLEVPKSYQIAEHSTTELFDPHKHLVVSFKDWQNQSDHFLSSIHVEYSCTPKIIVYIGFFFGIPLVVMIVISIICISRHNNYEEYDVLQPS